jgi:hypothetical protein
MKDEVMTPPKSFIGTGFRLSRDDMQAIVFALRLAAEHHKGDE